ncbi:(Fe-S)-binding protein [Geomonas anaerohicana]|uniref:4Fe-4S dicluster domain-containing protein n=1 Tax=Geomonas anaerohicana TaxID=2798583 RepID=A0ABS0YDC2_9BACT|nr:(Fe-S)-binding protein [Geomonas anaerohicana]MBJ6750300.1 4Fe-4S dicluster domain-containing protein [Geomonas anaerohicana]
MNQTLFTALLTVSLATFAFSCFRRLSLVTVGRSENRFDRPVDRLKEMLVYAIGQKRVVSRPFGLNHGIIFWAFLVLALANLEFLLSGLIPAVSFALLPAPLHGALLFLFDLCSLATLLAVTTAAVRRTVNPPFDGARTFEAYLILSMIAALMLAYFGLNGVRIAQGMLPQTSATPVSNLVAGLVKTTPAAAHLETAGNVFWWIHAVVLLGFMNFLPYSKHMHILTAIPNVFLRSLDKCSTQERETFLEGNSFGAATVERLSWKDLLDSFSCTECGRCQQSCPAASTGKLLNPREVIHAIKENLLQNGAVMEKISGDIEAEREISLIGNGKGGSTEEAALWSCTSCGACMEVCPVFIEHLPKIVKMRRHLVQMEARFPEELLNLFENMEQRSNPWGMAPSERSKWSSQLNLRPFEAGVTEYLLFVGCSGAFDARNKQVSVALTRVLDAAGVSYGVLGKEEKCCGDSVRRLGNEYLFDQMAIENVQQFLARGVTKIITQCPHCFTTLKNDYRQYGLELEVVHHSELINQLLTSGRLETTGNAEIGRVVFHDSCYLGRHNDVYDAPRQVLEMTTGRKVWEMGRNRENAFCCGAGGGRMWLEEHEGTPINRNRVQEALAQQPETVCVSCPFCMTMFEDGIKDVPGTTTQVRDIAEVVALSLQPSLLPPATS